MCMLTRRQGNMQGGASLGDKHGRSSPASMKNGLGSTVAALPTLLTVMRTQAIYKELVEFIKPN